VRGKKRFLARLMGHPEWLEASSYETMVVNHLFQRVIGLNKQCPYSVHYTSRIMHPARLTIGPGVERSLASSGGLYIQAYNGINIGEGTLIGWGVKLISANHAKGQLDQWDDSAPITIGRNVWIGANAVVLPGVTIGDDAVIGAGSVVTRDVLAGQTVVGVPARALHGADSGESE